MKLGDSVRKAVAERDLPLLGRMVDFLRFKYGFRYTCVFEACRDMVRKTGRELTLPEWDELMEACDEAESELGSRRWNHGEVQP